MLRKDKKIRVMIMVNEEYEPKPKQIYKSVNDGARENR